jgi:hypothetical protein
MSSRLQTLTIIITLFAPASSALAENCKALPAGPDRRACAMREHPEKFQAKLDHCRQLASDRGESGPKSGKKDFVRGCMHGKQQ